MLLSVRYAIPLALVALGGCASVNPDLAFKEVEANISQRLDQRVAWHRDTNADEAVAKAVRDLLAEPLTAERAVQIGLLNNRGLQAQYSELGVAQADLVEAGLLSNPTLGFARGVSSTTEKATIDVGFNLLSLILLPTRNRLEGIRNEQIRTKVSAAVIDYVAEAKTAYYAAVAAQQAVELYERAAISADAAADLARSQRRTGNIAIREEARHLAFRAETRGMAMKSRFAATAARERLARVLGVGKSIDIKLPPRLPDPPETEPRFAALEELALSQRLDLATARREVDFLGAALGVTQASRFVSLIDVGYEREKEKGAATLRTGKISIELPIFDQGNARLARHEAMLLEASNRLGELSVNAVSEVRERQHEVALAHALATEQRNTIVPLRQRVLTQTQLMYNGMLEGVYDLLTDFREAIAAGRELIDAQREYWTALAELEHAVGGKLPGLAAPSPAVAEPPAPPAGDDHSKHH